MKIFYKISRTNFTTKASTKAATNIRPVTTQTTEAAKNAKQKKQKNKALFNLLMTHKLVGSKSEINNYYENTLTNTKNKSAARQMLLNYFKNEEQEDKDNLLALYNFINTHLHSKELNAFFNLIRETQRILCSKNFEKTEELFQLFIDKLNKLTDNKGKFKY
jgi:hypothetical protein